MSLIENVKSCIGQSELNLPLDFRAVMFGGRAVYFENIKTIVSYTKEEIVLGLKKGTVKVLGQELYIKKYCQGDVVVCGQICRIENSFGQ